MSDTSTTAEAVGDFAGCARCGALIAQDGWQRHDAWHEFLEAGLTELTTDLVALAPDTTTQQEEHLGD